MHLSYRAQRSFLALWILAAFPSLLAAASVAAASVEVSPAPPRVAAAPAGDLGEFDFPTSAGSGAQQHFLRGVGALHSFWYDEAAEAFRAAQAADPAFAMAYWGEAMSLNHPIWNEIDQATGRAVLERLGASPTDRAAKAPTAREKAYLAAVEILFSAEGDKASRDRAYEVAMAEMAEDWPDDPEAKAFHALSLLGLVYGEQDLGAMRFPTLMRAAAPLEELFDEHPKHPGVLHYLIHSYDDPTHAPLGLRPARIYAQIAPAAHHALHMPSHIFVQLGAWDEVVASNEDAWAASVAWVERRDLDPAKRDFHSLGWLHYAYLQQGRRAKAEEVLAMVREAAATDSSPRTVHALEMIEARHLLATGAASSELAETSMPGRLYASGVAALRAGNREAASAALEHLRAPDEGMEGMHGRYDESTPIMALELEGQIALAAGEIDQGLELLRRAAEEEAEQPPPMGPPVPLEPASELYARALLEAGRAGEAAVAFEAALRRTPRRPASLLGAARAAVASQDPETARRLYRELIAIWHLADEEQPNVEEARAYLAAKS